MTNQQEPDILEQVDILRELSKEMNDPDIDKVIEITLKIIKKPDVPTGKAPELINELQAIATKFGLTKVYLKTFGKNGKNARYKKDVYYTAQDAVDRLVDSLKYVIRAQKIVGS